MPPDPEPLTGGRLGAAISDAITQVHSRYYGKGPREAKTYVQDDFVFCVLSDPFTTVEKTLIEVGRQTDVRNVRQAFQDAMENEFKQAVEALAGRRVKSFMSQTHVGPDLAIEIFSLEEAREPGQLDSEI